MIPTHTELTEHLSHSPQYRAIAATTTESLVTQNLPLVAHIVRETLCRVHAHVDRDDLTSAGAMALVQASRSWDAERGIPFTAYAARRIRGAMLDELRSVDGASRSVHRRGREIQSARATLAAELRMVPDDAQVATHLHLTPVEVQRCDEDILRASILSLDAADGNDDLAQQFVSTEPRPDSLLEHRGRLQYLAEAIEELPQRLRTVTRAYFFDDVPMTQLAVELGVSESRVSQIRAEALLLLRGALDRALDTELVTAPTRPDSIASRRRDTYFHAVAE